MAEPTIRPIALADIVSFRDCVSAVMRERVFLAYQEPFPLVETAAFVAGNLATGNPHFVADDGGRVVGWCDLRRETIPIYAHEGMLGMGVAAAYRGRGIGGRLLHATIKAARVASFERVTLSVYAKNVRAQALYRNAGFVVEGTCVRGKKLDGEYDDVLMMAYFCQEHRDAL